MNSRERVLASIKHREPDRIAIDLSSTPSSGISAIAYNRLKAHLSINDGHNRIYDVVQQVSQPETSILSLFKIDVIDVGRAFNEKDSEWYETTLSDGSKGELPVWFRPVIQKDGSREVYKDGELIAKMPKGATFYDQTVYPYIDGYPADYKRLEEAMGRVHWAALAHSPWDHASDEGFWERLRAEAIHLRETTDKALMIVCGCNLFEWGTFLRRIDNFLMDIYTSPKEVEGLLDALVEVHLRTLEKVCKSVGDVVDILRFGDDLGMDMAPFMAPEIYRRLFKPRHALLCDYVKKNSQMNTFLHSCGSIYKLIPDLIEAGYDIINPVQTTCVDMEPEKLKKEFGRDITFWGGGCDTRHILNHGTPDHVKDHVKRKIEILAPGGGFVFNQEHNILPDVPPENITAMYEAIRDYD